MPSYWLLTPTSLEARIFSGSVVARRLISIIDSCNKPIGRILPQGRARPGSPGRESSTLGAGLLPSKNKGQFFQKLLGSDPARLAESEPFDQVDPSLAPQNVAHRRLADLHFLGQILLGQSSVGTNAGHYFQYGFLISGVNRLCHGGKVANPALYRKSWRNIGFPGKSNVSKLSQKHSGTVSTSDIPN